MLLFELIQLLFENPLYFLIFFIIITFPLLISITIHEWAHGFVAYKFGDPTPKEQGRLSLNPFKHLDPMGTLMLFIIGIGWAKPVEINPFNINDRFKLMLVALAGPLSNFIMAILFSFILYLFITILNLNELNLKIYNWSLLKSILKVTIQVNLVLGLFNLLPLPPLDGSNIVRNLLPENLSEAYFRLAPYGLPILLVLVFTGTIDHIFNFAEFLQVQLLDKMAVIFDPIFKMFL